MVLRVSRILKLGKSYRNPITFRTHLRGGFIQFITVLGRFYSFLEMAGESKVDHHKGVLLLAATGVMIASRKNISPRRNNSSDFGVGV